MKNKGDSILLSAGDLSGHMACSYLTWLNLAAINGVVEVPGYRDPTLALLQERGREFEQAYLEKLASEGLKIVQPGKGSDLLSRQDTIAAMEKGVDVIYQAMLTTGIWQGRADFLIKVEKPGKLGNWSYEVHDSKLARETRSGTILQLCLYSELVAGIQGVMPELMHVITPEDGFSKHIYRLDDYLAYYRFIKKGLQAIFGQPKKSIPVYPGPNSHCDICSWWQHCDAQRRKMDHLSLVAGLSGGHANEIKRWKIETLEKFARISLPLKQKPKRGAVETYTRLREQARVQLEARKKKQPIYEHLAAVEGRGLFNLPAPSPGDIFFDLEGDPFAGTTGIEYLFGWVLNNEPKKYHCIWSLTPEKEKEAFETFVDTVMALWEKNSDLHIYHFTAYEPSALKRIMGRYATRENEIDQMLRAKLFVDLHGITKQALRAGIETYSLKELEQFHNFRRVTPLRDAAIQLRAIQGFIERRHIRNIPPETILTIQGYNKEDCLSTRSLRSWLETLRKALIKEGHKIPRPALADGIASDVITEHQKRVAPLYDKLMSGLPIDPAARTAEQQARWLLANMLDWYRREKKATWWEFFRLRELPDNDLIEERAAIAHLRFKKRTEHRKDITDRYTFPPQETDVREGDELRTGEGHTFGKVIAIDITARLIDIKRTMKPADDHPVSVFRHSDVSNKVKEEAIIRIADWVVRNGMDVTGNYRAGRDLLLNLPPRSTAMPKNNEAPQEMAITWVKALKNGVLPIQGPPGTGKSHTAAAMILALIKAGKKVGITALSHKVVVGLMQKVAKEAKKNSFPVRCMRKVTSYSDKQDPDIIEETSNEEVKLAIQEGYVHVLGGTAWLWSRPDMANSVDVLFVDEAGQLSLIDTLAVSQAATNLVLLGDPQQLKQPQQGSHPEGTEVSALEHILQEHKTILPQRGIFLDTTWRLHPAICSFVSELSYEHRLIAQPELIHQQLIGKTSFPGAGLWFQPVRHEGNQNASEEEVKIVTKIIKDLLKGAVSYQDSKKKKKTLTVDDIKVITPYNAQVSLLAAALPEGVQVGTVDKFQGQEAPVVIFSMATSTPEDAPRGMEFLYSLNRLNVAVSRAKATFILVANPALFEPNCKTVAQMKLANAFCRYLEMAEN